MSLTARAGGGAASGREPSSDAGGELSDRARRWRPQGPFVAIWIATALVFAAGGLLAPSSLTSSALLSMLPFAAVLAIAAAGQTLVLQQGGMDLSVAGSMSLAATILTNHAEGNPDRVVVGVILAIAVTTLIGFGVGTIVTRLQVPAIVATLVVNALLLGFVEQVSGGFPAEAPDNLHDLVAGKTASIPHTVILAVVTVAALAILVSRTVLGRRFVLVGANPDAARVAGIAVRRYETGAYVVAGGCYGIAGVVVAGFLQAPGLFVGNPYLLTTIAAVVLGGTSLAGGSGSVIATAVAALFITQLNQIVVLIGGSAAVQLVIMGVIVATAMAVHTTGMRGRSALRSANRWIGRRRGLERVRARAAASAPQTEATGRRAAKGEK
jgi:ribose transport system permease protein